MNQKKVCEFTKKNHDLGEVHEFDRAFVDLKKYKIEKTLSILKKVQKKLKSSSIFKKITNFVKKIINFFKKNQQF